MSNVSQTVQDDNQADPYTDDGQDARTRALGEPLTVLMDRKRKLQLALIEVEYEIYCEQTNRLVSQIGVMAALFDAKLQKHSEARS
jgi:hypothetical protein